MSEKKTLFWKAVDKCAIMIFRIEICADNRWTRDQIYSRYNAINSPRFLRAVSARIRDLQCQQFLNAVDSIADIGSKLPDGRRDRTRFVTLRKGLHQYSLVWLIGELRDSRLDQFGAREMSEFADKHNNADKEQSLRTALSDFQKSTKRNAEERKGQVVVYTPPKVTSSRRDDADLKRFKARLGEPMPLRRANDRHHLDEMISAAFEAAPWMSEPLEWIWRHNILLLDDAQPRLEIPPMLLVGDPGVGKTHFARLLCDALGLHYARIDMSARSAAFDLTGMEHGWSTSTPGIPVRTLATSPIANPVIILDEVEKAGRSSNGGSPEQALLPLLQREMSKEFLCPSLQAVVDLSWCGWIGTANDIDLLSGPIRDRMRIFHVKAPAGRDLHVLVRRTLEPVDAAPEVIGEVCRQIEAGRMSLRGLGRLANEFRALQTQPMMH
jgi:hypothetical protein